jgi:hypothetical protein
MRAVHHRIKPNKPKWRDGGHERNEAGIDRFRRDRHAAVFRGA